MKYRFFRLNNRWSWIVLRDGRVIANGTRHETEQAARNEFAALRSGIREAIEVKE